ncbi:hypothetical protein RSO41_13265 [Halomonas sp. I1]|uniref:hypothetical protein n=1 Tax=Halomonas sp. I1 TaxID=393536 RepID=UPI0028DD698D|nr:hypothetical protein [Halomonas sp. I1]MDT8895621.1 hypothetical protein [Halomonas sp. I1]
MATPQLDTQNVTDRIFSLPEGEGWGSFRVRSIQKEIDSIQKEDAAIGFMLTGILSAKLRDYRSVVSFFSKAERIAPTDDAMLWNYAAALNLLAQYDEAGKIFERLLDTGNVNAINIKAALWANGSALNLEAFERIYNKYAQAVTDEVIMSIIEDLRASSSMVKGFMSQDSTLQADAQKMVQHLQSTLFDHKATLSSATPKIDNFYGQSVLHLYYGVNASVETVITLNDDLLERVSDDEAITHWDSIIPSFVKVSDEE